MNILQATGEHCTKVRRNKTVYQYIKKNVDDVPVFPVASLNPSLYIDILIKTNRVPPVIILAASI
jgi:hypothetical protein